MRKFSLCLAALLPCAVAAQAPPKAEVFAGYQYTRTEDGGNWNGWNASFTASIERFLGLTADVSQAYNSGVHFTTFAFGPEFHTHLPVVKPFVHALAGGASISGSAGSNSAFITYLGGGVDAGHGRIAWRVAQFDWLYVQFPSGSSVKNVRVSTGLVFRF